MTLKTVSRKTEEQQSLKTEHYEIMYAFKHEAGKVPEMITARATTPNQKLKEGEHPFRVDVSLYPERGNLQITCHNKPEGFDLATLDEIVKPFDEILAELGE